MARAKKTKGASADRSGQTDPTAPLDGGELLAAARPVLELLREDLSKRAEDARVDRALRARHEDEKTARRTADSFGEWRDGLLAQVAASWFLSCVFVRTLEDRGLLGSARIAGPGATDSQKLFVQLAPSLTERDYLLFVFRELAELPAARALFDREHAMVWQLSPSADAAKDLLRLFRTPSAEEPAFRFGQPSTRFLGDLYQDLYEDVRKRYALLQTPDFIESFILDRTLEPAIERFGLDDTTLIDPTCGSGHFLLGAFDRLFEHRLRAQPGIDVRQAAHQALDAVYGADINPYAAAIARVRLTLSYLEKARIRHLKDAPVLPLHLVVADSLLYNPQHAQLGFEHQEGQSTVGWRTEAFQLEDPVAARDVLHRQYTAVVGNPPYITEKDSAKRETYRAMYPRSAAGKYALSAPFCERFFQLARERGSVGQITANSFMKREFGKKLIEDYLKNVNLEVIANTSGVYIPGHGTPTVLLFGTHEPPTSRSVLTVLAKRGEPSTPSDPATGEVWSSITAHWRDLGFDNDFITVANTDRDKLAVHPWSLGGGGAVELKELLEDRAEKRLGELVSSIGFMAITGEDDVFARPRASWLRVAAEPEWIRDFGIGEDTRDWALSSTLAVAFPYRDAALSPPDQYPCIARLLWPYRRILLNRPDFGGKRYIDVGRTWFEYHQVPLERLKTPLSIAFAFVATHNHFVLDRGSKVFNRTAPVIKLPATTTEDDHFALLAYLNSSTACFWMKQVMMNKGATSDSGVLQADEDKFRFEFDGTKLLQAPVPRMKHRATLIELARKLSFVAASITANDYLVVLEHSTDKNLIPGLWTAISERHQFARELCVALQEEIDWLVYDEFGLLDTENLLTVATPLVGYSSEDRPFISESSDPLRSARRRALEKTPLLSLVERREFKRRWYRSQGKFKAESVGALQWMKGAIQRFCLGMLEGGLRETSTPIRGLDARHIVQSCIDIVEAAQKALPAAAEDVFDPWSVFSNLLDIEAVPFLASYRFNEDGLRKYEQWQRTWNQQRVADRGGGDGVAVPPKYSADDFLDHNVYRLRGKLDVPKERFISYPGCESDEDGEPVYGWAGWNHLQRAQALASLYQKRKTEEGWTADRLTPMLAGLLELLPWVKQWHNEPDVEFDDQRMGDFFAQFLDGECQALGLTHADLEAWRPTKKTARKNSPVAATEDDDDGEVAKPKRARKQKAAIAETSGESPPMASPPEEHG